MKQYRAIFFDFINTLADPSSDREAHRAFVKECVKNLGIVEFNLDRWVDIFEENFENLYNGSLGAPDFCSLAEYHAKAFEQLLMQELSNEMHSYSWEDVKQWGQKLMDYHVDYNQLYPLSLPVLIECKKYGLHTGIISDYDDVAMAKLVTRLGLADVVDSVTTSEEVGAYKPNPILFQIALEKARISAEQAIFVGDRWERDILGAKRVGMMAILVGKETSKQPYPDFIISNIGELSPLLPTILGGKLD